MNPCEYKHSCCVRQKYPEYCPETKGEQREVCLIRLETLLETELELKLQGKPTNHLNLMRNHENKR